MSEMPESLPMIGGPGAASGAEAGRGAVVWARRQG
jgi:hypothetical protein